MIAFRNLASLTRILIPVRVVFPYTTKNSKFRQLTLEDPAKLQGRMKNSQNAETGVDLSMISNMLRVMTNKPQESCPTQQSYVEKYIHYLDVPQVLLLLQYLYSKYGRMSQEKLVVSTVKRIRQISELTSVQFRRLVASLLMLKWEQDPIVTLYDIMSKQIHNTSTEDLTYLVLYAQHVRKINLQVYSKFVSALSSRQDHTRKTHFLLYQALYSTESKNNIDKLLQYRQAVLSLDNALKGSNYQIVFGKDELIAEINGLERSRKGLEQTLSIYQQLTLRQAVVLGGVANQQLLSNVEQILKDNLQRMTPKCALALIHIVPKQEYLVQFLQQQHSSMTVLQKLQFFQRASEIGMPKSVLQEQFLSILSKTPEIPKEALNKLCLFGESIGVEDPQAIYNVIGDNQRTNKKKSK